MKRPNSMFEEKPSNTFRLWSSGEAIKKYARERKLKTKDISRISLSDAMLFEHYSTIDQIAIIVDDQYFLCLRNWHCLEAALCYMKGMDLTDNVIRLFSDPNEIVEEIALVNDMKIETILSQSQSDKISDKSLFIKHECSIIFRSLDHGNSLICTQTLDDMSQTIKLFNDKKKELQTLDDEPLFKRRLLEDRSDLDTIQLEKNSAEIENHSLNDFQEQEGEDRLCIQRLFNVTYFDVENFVNTHSRQWFKKLKKKIDETSLKLKADRAKGNERFSLAFEQIQSKADRLSENCLEKLSKVANDLIGLEQQTSRLTEKINFILSQGERNDNRLGPGLGHSQEFFAQHKTQESPEYFNFNAGFSEQFLEDKKIPQSPFSNFNFDDDIFR